MAAAAAPAAQSPDNAALVARARAIHDRVITLDTHVDINPRDFTVGAQLHPAARDPGQPAQDGGRRSRCRLLHRLCRSGSADPGRLRPGVPAGSREVRRDPPPGRGDRAETDRTGPDRRRCAEGGRVGSEGRVDRRRERLFARHRPRPGQGVPRPRRPLHVAGPQRQQPVRRLQHQRAHRHATSGTQRARPPGHRRDEQVGHHDRPVPPVEGCQPAGHRAVEGAGDRVPLGGAGCRRSQPQPRRRAAPGDSEERRRRAGRRLRQLRQDQAARLAGAGGSDRQAAPGSSVCRAVRPP